MGESNVYTYDETNPLEQQQRNVLHYHSEPQDTTTYLVQLPDSRPAVLPFQHQTRRSRTTSILNTHQLPNTIEEEKEPLEAYIRKNLSTFRRSLTPEDLERTSTRYAKDKINGEDSVIGMPVDVQEIPTDEMLSYSTYRQQNHCTNEDIKLMQKKYKHKNSDAILETYDNAEPPDKKTKRENRIKRSNLRTSFKDEVTVFPLIYDPVNVSHASPFEKEKNESNRRPSSRVKVMIMIDSDEDETEDQLRRKTGDIDKSKQKQKPDKNRKDSKKESGDEETIWQNKDYPKKKSERNEKDLDSFDEQKERSSKVVHRVSQIGEDNKSDDISPKDGEKASECEMHGHKGSRKVSDGSDRKNKPKPREEDKGLPDQMKPDHGNAKDDNEMKGKSDSKKPSRDDSTSYPDKTSDENNNVNVADKTKKTEPPQNKDVTSDEELPDNDRNKQPKTKKTEDPTTQKKMNEPDDDSTVKGQPPKRDKRQNDKSDDEKHSVGEPLPRVDEDGSRPKAQSKRKSIEEDRSQPRKSSKVDKIPKDVEPHKRKSRDSGKREGPGKNPRYLTLKAPRSKTQMQAMKRYHIQIPEHGRPETGFNVRFNLNDENNVDMTYDGPVKITNYYSSNKYL